MNLTDAELQPAGSGQDIFPIPTIFPQKIQLQVDNFVEIL